MIKYILILVIFLFKPNRSSKCSPGFSGPQCEECGLSFVQTNVRIIGGIEALPKSWPSIAMVVFNYTFDFTYMGRLNKKTVYSTCGGTLIDNGRVITAAHCFVQDMSFSFNGTNIPVKVRPNLYHPTFSTMYTIYLGLHNLTSVMVDPSNIFPAVAVPIKNFKLHPKFNSNSLQNDIAIIELVNYIILNERIQTACLPEPNFELKTNSSAWVAGWGSIKSGGSYSPTLQNVKITIYNSTFCNRIFSKKNWTTQICAGEYDGGKDTCQGDSGGPLMIKQFINGKERAVLIGITSYGLSCGMPKYPAVYTKVSAFLNWINTGRSNELNFSSIEKPKEIPTLPPINCNKTSCETCGLRFARPSFRIIGGVEANPYSWPSIALIVFNYKFDVNINQQVAQVTKEYTCCGSLIDNQTILTAAHCYIREVKTFDSEFNSERILVRPNSYYRTMRSMYTVYLGLHDKKSLSDNLVKAPVVKLPIKSFIIHPLFNSSNYINDIGIIKLREPVKLNQYIQPACLPKMSMYPRRYNRSSWAVGWGSMSFNSSITHRLQNVEMILYESHVCNNIYPEVKKNWKRQLCSGYLKGGKDTCDGDSGGPLYLRERVNGKFRFLLAGITSYGDGCGLPGKAGIYTRVSRYLGWIRRFLSGTHNRNLNSKFRKN